MSLKHNHDFGVWGGYVITSGDAVTLAEKACRGGARILQYRDKTATRRQMLKTAGKLRSITADHGALFIVNDYIDIALLAGADGVHLGQDDIPIQNARSLTPDGFIIGISTHSIDQAKKAEADGADYIGIGPVFSTPSKPDYVPIGIATVRIVANVVRIPFVAIGGINLANIRQLKDIGVVNAAMIRDFAGDTEETVRQVNRLLLGRE
ncbi:MAG: thiamine phosphate synthase [Candidatus Zixiibacteriota bacterium]